ncbi:cyclin-L1 [Hydra vulgaris]|uniref:Cyclin-L1 n=1 Tax=Hydra vulgaris TaxID=6087 RepID=A0ABM4C1A5_HYDVU
MAVADKKPPPKEYDYDDIVISLENCILPSEKIDVTPSMKDGLDRDTETELRMLGCEMIQIAGLLLKLPQVAMATGQVILQRFYYSKSLIKHEIDVTTMAAVYLAAKIEEAPRRIRDIINVCYHIRQRKLKKPIIPMDFLSTQYFNMKNAVIKAERRILIELGFCVHIKHPHKIIITYLQILDAEKNVALARRAWNYMNDSLRTDVFVRYVPEKVACSCIFLAARIEKINLPLRPPWWELFDITNEEIEEIALIILRLYSTPRRKLSTLQSIVGKIKKLHQEKKESEEAVAAAKPGSFTPAYTQSSNTVNTNNTKPASKSNSPEKDSEKKLNSVITSRVERSFDSHERHRDSSNHQDRRRKKSDESNDSTESESDSESELPSRKYARQRKQYESKKRSSASSDTDSDHCNNSLKNRRSLSPIDRKREKLNEYRKERNGHHRNDNYIKPKKRSRSRSPVKRMSSPQRKYHKDTRNTEVYRDKYLKSRR